jgi:tRNA(Ile2) C34 agmatinyltransferase TiaS
MTAAPTLVQQIGAALTRFLRCPRCGGQGRYRGEDVWACACGQTWRLLDPREAPR